MKIMVINGPNINLIGKREPEIYGNQNYAFLKKLIEKKSDALNITTDIFQTNHEGIIIDLLHEAKKEKYNGVVINPGGYTHTSIAIMDAISAIDLPCIEVHISNLSKREDFRQSSYTSKAVMGTITGLGLYGYILAMDGLRNYIISNEK